MFMKYITSYSSGYYNVRFCCIHFAKQQFLIYYSKTDHIYAHIKWICLNCATCAVSRVCVLYFIIIILIICHKIIYFNYMKFIAYMRAAAALSALSVYVRLWCNIVITWWDVHHIFFFLFCAYITYVMQF